MDKEYAFIVTPVDATVLSQILSGLNSSFQVGIQDDSIVIFREEY